MDTSPTASAAPVTSSESFSIGSTLKNLFSKVFFHLGTLIALFVSFAIVYTLGLTVTILINAITSGIPMSELLVIGKGTFSFSYVPQTAAQFAVFIPTLLVFVAVMYICLGWLFASIISLLSSSEKIGMKEALRQGKPFMFRLTGLLILVSFIVSLATFLFVIPGIYFAIALSVSSLVLVRENAGIKQSLATSMAYVKGRWFSALAYFVGVFILSLLISIVGGFILSFAAILLAAIMPESIIAAVISWIILALVYLLTMILSTSVMFGSVVSLYEALKASRPQVVVPPSAARTITLICVAGIIIALLSAGAVTKIVSSHFGSFESFRERAEELQKQNQGEEASMYPEGSYEAQLIDLFEQGSVTEAEGSTGNMRFTGYGVSFETPRQWTDIGADDKRLARFVESPFVEEDLTKIVSLQYQIAEEGEAKENGYEYIQTLRESIEAHKDRGTIDSYSITRFAADPSIGVLTTNYSSADGMDSLQDRNYYITKGRNLYIVIASGLVKDFAEADAVAKMIVTSIEFDPLIERGR